MNASRFLWSVIIEVTGLELDTLVHSLGTEGVLSARMTGLVLAAVPLPWFKKDAVERAFCRCRQTLRGSSWIRSKLLYRFKLQSGTRVMTSQKEAL